MAADLTQDAVLRFLQSRRGSVKNSELLLHFRFFLRDHAERERNRDLFKKFVNSVATVRQEPGGAHVVLRKKFRGHGEAPSRREPGPVPGGSVPGGSVPPGSVPGGSVPPGPVPGGSVPGRSVPGGPIPPGPVPGGSVPRKPVPVGPVPGRSVPRGPGGGGEKPRQPEAAAVLPAAGILADNNYLKPREAPGAAAAEAIRPAGTGSGSAAPPAPRLAPLGRRVRGPEAPPPDGGLHPEPAAPRRVRLRKSYKSACSCDEDADEEEPEVRGRPSSSGGVWSPGVPLGSSSKALCASSPCVVQRPPDPTRSSPPAGSPVPRIYVQAAPQRAGPGWSLEPGGPQEDQGLESRRLQAVSKPSQAGPLTGGSLRPAAAPGEPSRGQRSGLSSSHRDIFLPSSDAGFSGGDGPPLGSSRGSGQNGGAEDLQDPAGERVGRAAFQGGLPAPEPEPEPEPGPGPGPEPEPPTAQRRHARVPWHRSAGELYRSQEAVTLAPPSPHSTRHLHDNRLSAPSGLPCRRSTGDLCGDGESSDGSASSPAPVRRHPAAARRLSGRLKSRMCRSLCTDLDQAHQEEAARGAPRGNEAARLQRLHRISSSLSLRYNLSSSSLSSCSTPPGARSLADLTEKVDETGARRSGHREGLGGQSLVPLEAREHAWLVKGAAGAWPDIYSLFREDSSLLNKRDFISGFTVLHWIAKHGDHRVLNTLWYGVQKAGATLDVNARSANGHTPLHIAAMYNSKNIIRLLVNKFDADVKRRDTAGKRPWQYLDRGAPQDVLQILGAPSPTSGGGGGGGGGGPASPREDPGPGQKQQRRRRRRHYLSSASGERPLTISGTTKVKRSSSIAAFLKHKSLARFHGHQSDSSV